MIKTFHYQSLLSPGDGRLLLNHKTWTQPILIDQVAVCQLYNTMEARVEWHPVLVEWEHLQELADGWRVPCRVDIPFVGTMLTCMLQATETRADALEITIREVVERDTTLARLMRLDLFPELGAARYGEDGYLLLPCYSGALHAFTHRVSREERLGIYAVQEQWASKSNFNCIGMHTPKRSWCAMVTEGDCDAEAVIRSCWEEEQTTSIHIGLVYRWEKSDELITGNRTVRYHLLNPPEGGWSAMARIYRRFLREERNLRTWEEKAAENPSVKTFASSFLLKIFQGYKKATLDGRGDYQSCTSFQEAGHILAQMRADGIRNLTAELVGWNDQGHDGTYPSRFPVNGIEGGEDDLRQLLD